jgi:glucosamine--fructose-6-phosphate aminotransferase (isomerizing)
MPVLGFVQDDAAKAGTLAVLRELAVLRVPVLSAGPGSPGGSNGPAGITALPVLPSEHPDADLITQLASFYIAAEATARARGHDPDHPPGLLKITETV